MQDFGLLEKRIKNIQLTEKNSALGVLKKVVLRTGAIAQ